jgi:hypothetical protein
VGVPGVDRAISTSHPVIRRDNGTALATCAKIDECKNWADKAEALASYAKQANDRDLHVMADRIQARAIRREGELLEEIESARGKQPL